MKEETITSCCMFGCPMKRIEKRGSVHFGKCDGADCMWWIDYSSTRGNCVIANISAVLDEIRVRIQ